MDHIIYAVLLLSLSLFILFAVVAFEKWNEYSQRKQLHALVSWSIIADHPFGDISGHELPLWSYISNTQIQLNIPQEYRISGDIEWGWIKEIIDEYKKDLVISYMKCKLTIIKSKNVINGEDYFMNALRCFLKEHQCDHDFLGYKMHKERLEYRRYGDWGGPCYDATYSLTDFAITFHKLYYIVYLYCKNNSKLNPNGDIYNNGNSIKKVLDTHNLEVYAGT